MTTSIYTDSQPNLTTTLPQWKPATWEDYLRLRDDPTNERIRLYFHCDRLLVDMGSEGINHATVSDLFTVLFFIWFSQRPEQIYSSLGRCLLEKPTQKAGAPDLVLYVGENYPRLQPGERRYLNLDRWRVPNLVGEIADTTLPTDLDEKKQLYSNLGIPEYWVIDVRGQRVFAFQLQENGKYLECANSLALEGLPISLLNRTLERLNEESNGSAASWFAQQTANIKSE